MLKDSKKLILGVFGLLSLVLLLTAATYAFFSSATLGDQIVRLTTNGVTFSYKEGTNTIRLNNAMPMTDEEGMYTNNYFEFDITSSMPKRVSIPYYITARKGSNSSNIDDAIKIYLSRVIRADKDIYAVHMSIDNFETNECAGLSDMEKEFLKITCTKMPNNDSLYHIEAFNDSEMFDTVGECNTFLDSISSGFGANVTATCAKFRETGEVIDEQEIVVSNYDDFNQYSNNKIDVSNYTEKLIYNATVPYNNSNYKETYRLRMWIDYDTDFSQSKYNNANFSLTINVYSNGSEKPRLAAGLYDADDNLIETYEEMVRKYNFDPTKDQPQCHPNGNHNYLCYDETTGNWLPYEYNDLPNDMLFKILLNYEYIFTTKIVLPDSITTIGDSVFANCNGLEEVILPNHLTTISDNAFYHCENLKNVEIPSSLTYLGARAFNNCRSLESIELPDNLTEIKESTFYECLNLTNIKLPANLLIIEDGAFFASNLSNVELPEGLITISNNSFERCTNLKKIEIPSSLTTIGADAFNYCINLRIVTLEENSNLSSVGAGAFKDTIWYQQESQNNTVPVYLNGVLVEEDSGGGK